MKIVRWAAVAVTILMSLMNLGVALDHGDTDRSAALVTGAVALGAAGLVAAAGLALRARWGRGAVLAVGVANLVGAVAAVAADREGAVIGIAVSLLVLACGALSPAGAPASRASAPSVG
jgi:hypothetical protein